MSVSEAPQAPHGGEKPRKPQKVFDFTKYPSSHIVFKIAYHGQEHDGLAKQVTTTNTIESIFCDALKKVRLIPDDGPKKFSRCGRTDKGVSALGNAFSLIVRSSGDDEKNPLDYPKMINNVLPPTVRVVGWCAVPDDFDARFSCKSRSYRYYFDSTGLDIPAMRKACSYLVGKHNFRNFCKLDVTNVSNFVREVHVADIVTPQSSLSTLSRVSFLTIEANGFLYHQIRCTMSVLFLVGQQLETPEIVQELLMRGDAKPCYPLADETPLVLWECQFDPDVVQWRLGDAAQKILVGQLADISSALLIRAAAAEEMKNQLLNWFPPFSGSKADEDSSLLRPTGFDWTRGEARRTAAAASSPNPQSYVKLLDRSVEMSFGERVAGLSKAKRARFEENSSKRSAPPCCVGGGEDDDIVNASHEGD